MELDPTALTTAQRYKLLIGGIVPRPIAVVSTISPGGHRNVAPYSFFNGIGSDPMTLLFCPSNKTAPGTDGSWEKDSLRNAKPIEEGGTGAFVVNVADESILNRIVATSAELPYGESEFELAGLRELASSRIAPPRIAESPLAYECRTLQVVRLHPETPGGGNIVIGEVVCVHVREDLINERLHIDAERLAAVGRMGGQSYVLTRERFDMPRGDAALNAPLPF